MNKKENKEISKDYYINTNKKVLDFLIGFFGVYVAYVALSFLINVISFPIISYFESIGSDFLYSGFFFLSPIIILVFFLVSLWLAFKNNRRFIAFGLITALSLPLLAFGACFTIFGVLSNF